MEKITINLTDEFKDNLCSFNVAKKAKAAGMTSANTFYAYDENGGITDGGWMEAENNIKMIREQTGKPDWKPPVLYPAINIPMAIGMLEDTTLDLSKVECYETFDDENQEFCFKYKDEIMRNKKLVDLLVEVWIKYKK